MSVTDLAIQKWTLCSRGLACPARGRRGALGAQHLAAGRRGHDPERGDKRGQVHDLVPRQEECSQSESFFNMQRYWFGNALSADSEIGLCRWQVCQVQAHAGRAPARREVRARPRRLARIPRGDEVRWRAHLGTRHPRTAFQASLSGASLSGPAFPGQPSRASLPGPAFPGQPPYLQLSTLV